MIKYNCLSIKYFSITITITINKFLIQKNVKSPRLLQQHN